MECYNWRSILLCGWITIIFVVSGGWYICRSDAFSYLGLFSLMLLGGICILSLQSIIAQERLYVNSIFHHENLEDFMTLSYVAKWIVCLMNTNILSKSTSYLSPNCGTFWIPSGVPMWDRILRHEKWQNRSITQSRSCDAFIISVFRLTNFSKDIYDLTQFSNTFSNPIKAKKWSQTLKSFGGIWG